MGPKGCACPGPNQFQCARSELSQPPKSVGQSCVFVDRLASQHGCKLNWGQDDLHALIRAGFQGQALYWGCQSNRSRRWRSLETQRAAVNRLRVAAAQRPGNTRVRHVGRPPVRHPVGRSPACRAPSRCGDQLHRSRDRLADGLWFDRRAEECHHSHHAGPVTGYGFWRATGVMLRCGGCSNQGTTTKRHRQRCSRRHDIAWKPSGLKTL